MSTGSFSITSVQPIALTPPSVAPSSTSGDSNGFNTLYQDTLNNSTSSQQEASSTASKSTPRSEDKDNARATADTERSSSSQRRDKSRSAADKEKDVASTKGARKNTDQAEKPDDEAANDVLASIAVEQMRTSEAQQQEADGLRGTAVMATQRKDNANTPVTQQPSASDTRNDALQQALALQQLVDQKHSEQTTAANAADTLKAAAQNSGLQNTTLSDRRELNASEGLNASSERTRSRTTSVTTSQNAGASLNQGALSSATLGKDDELSVEGSTSRSQADFDLQYALNQVSGSHSHTQATSSASSLPPIDSEHWNDALASHISTMSRLDQGQTTLTLAPASLGSLEVSLQMDRGQADIQFVTHSRQAHDALTSSVHSLHNALADQGIQLQNVSIVDNHPDAGQQTSQQQHAFSGMASDQQSSRHSAQEQAAPHDTVALSTQEERTDQAPASSTSSNTVHGLRATA